MKTNKLRVYLFLIALAGTLFSGYLTATKLISGTCALNETCPVLFGQPACLFGFLIYFTLFVLSTIIVLSKQKKIIKPLLMVVIILSGIGIIFSAYVSYLDLVNFSNTSYALILPSCVYGFFMFVFYFYLSLRTYKLNFSQTQAAKINSQ